MADTRKALILRPFNIGTNDGLSARPAAVGEIDDVPANAYDGLKRDGLIADPTEPTAASETVVTPAPEPAPAPAAPAASKPRKQKGRK